MVVLLAFLEAVLVVSGWIFVLGECFVFEVKHFGIALIHDGRAFSIS